MMKNIDEYSQKFTKIEDPKFQFLAMNAHLDHVSELARFQGSKLIAKLAKEISNREDAKDVPLFLLGDFNCAPNHAAHQVFISNGFSDSYDEFRNHVAMMNDACPLQRHVASTYHHYFGIHVNYPLARFLQFFLFWNHGKIMPRWDRYHVDWILKGNFGEFSGDVDTLYSGIITDHIQNQYPSDHFPVISLFNITRR
jgi:hypothetical protein